MCSCKTFIIAFEPQISNDGLLHEMEERDDPWQTNIEASVQDSRIQELVEGLRQL